MKPMSSPILKSAGSAEDAMDAPSIVCGLDGFVDEMITVVGQRSSPAAFTPLSTLGELGALVSAAAGRNSLREIVVNRQDAGGCAINLGDGLAALGAHVHYVGTVGAPVHPAFAPVLERFASATALGSCYGRTLCFEFSDGKFMFSAMQQLAEITPAVVSPLLPLLVQRCRTAQVLCLTNWTLYPHMSAVWRLIQEQVPLPPRVFIDLVDPSGRSTEDILAMCDLLPGFGQVSLSVNRTELAVLAQRLELPARDDAGELAAALRARLGIAEVVVHNVQLNAVASAAGVVVRPSGPHCAAPLKTTGAGDRFNAGYVFGLATGLGPRDRLDLGAATAGHFIRHAASGSLAECQAYLPR
jgi:fructose-1-phosphate kinase PfkB-like protein